MKIKYNSTHLSYEEQLKKFIDRGMEVKDKEFCLTKLASINYYKLKEFSIPYYKNGSYQIPKGDTLLDALDKIIFIVEAKHSTEIIQLFSGKK